MAKTPKKTKPHTVNAKITLVKGLTKISPVKKAKAPTKKSATKKLSASEKELKEEMLKEANRIINSSPKKKSKRPVKVRSQKENTSLLDAVVAGMQEKKAKHITVLNLTDIENRVCDYFVIGDAESKTHVNAIAESVEEYVLKHNGEKPYHSEGHDNSEWILIDYINIVAHVFQEEVRQYYALEDLWADAEIEHIKD